MRLRSKAAVRGVLAVWALVGLPSVLTADTIFMRNGRTYYGKIITQSATEVTIRTATGTITVRKTEVRRLTYESFEDAVKKQEAAAAAARARARARREAEERRKRESLARRERDLEEARLLREEYRKQEALVRAERAAFLRKQVEEGKVNRDEIKEPIGFFDFAWRSMVFPGWGHIHIEKPVLGIAYGVIFVGLVGRVASTRSAAVSAQAANEQEVLTNTLLYGSATSLAQEARFVLAAEANRRMLTEYKGALDRYHASLGTLALFYGIQLVHIILDGLTWESGGLLGGGESPLDSRARWSVALFPEGDVLARPGVQTGLHAQARVTIPF